MTQRVFDIENEQDIVDLWEIIPDNIDTIKGTKGGGTYLFKNRRCMDSIAGNVIKINWHDKTEIYRPFTEATEADIGKLCKFWDKVDYYAIGILSSIATSNNSWKRFVMESKENGYYKHCRPLKYKELKELCRNDK